MGAISEYVTAKFMGKVAEQHIRQHPQMAVFAFDGISSDICIYGQYEKDELEFLATAIFPTLKEKLVCLDVGANIGNHSLSFAKSFDRVLAFEPHPKTFKLLEYNAKLTNNIEAVNKGLSNSNRIEKVRVPTYSTNIGGTTLTVQSGHKDGTTEFNFELQCLDDFVQQNKIDAISFIKIDVEGHEVECLKGATKTLGQFRPPIAMEILGRDIVNGNAESITILKQLGYSYFYELEDTNIVNKLPRPLYKLTRFVSGFIMNKRLTKRYQLRSIQYFKSRNYSMIICSHEPIA